MSVSQVAEEDTVQLLELEVTPTVNVPPVAEASTASVVSHREAGAAVPAHAPITLPVLTLPS